jgi:hypothetical protein
VAAVSALMVASCVAPPAQTTTTTTTVATPAAPIKTGTVAPPDAVATGLTRRDLDNLFLEWCTSKKAIPGSASACSCTVDQMHIQGLDDAGARRLADIVTAAPDASGPHFSLLSRTEKDQISQASANCGVKILY